MPTGVPTGVPSPPNPTFTLPPISGGGPPGLSTGIYIMQRHLEDLLYVLILGQVIQSVPQLAAPSAVYSYSPSLYSGISPALAMYDYILSQQVPRA